MVAERQERYPKGTYRLQTNLRPGNRTAYRLTNLVTKRSYCCCSLWQLLNALDSDLTANRYPQKAVQYRSWEVNKRMKDPVNDNISAEPVDGSPSPTFVIRVLFRQNATWQGTIQWLEGKQTRQFRSEFEMLKLMDEAMQQSAADEQHDTTGWDS